MEVPESFTCLCRSVGVDLTLDDFQKVSDKVPFLADLKPSGKYVMEDLHKVYVALLLFSLNLYVFVCRRRRLKFLC